MKKEVTTKIYNKMGMKEDHTKVNSFVKAVIINFGDERGDIVVENDNFGTRRKYADFTRGKEKAGLHPLQIVFSGLELAHMFQEKYIGSDNKVHMF